MAKAPPSLDQFLQKERVALFLDFDGTLVDIAPTHDSITPAPDLGRRLKGLADRLHGAVALVSGRSLDDIARHIGALAVAGAGSHGADIRDAQGKAIGLPASEPPEAITTAMYEYANANGLGYEAKPHGAAIHYRSAVSKGPAAHAFAEELAHSHGWTTQSGKCVVEVVAGKADKGSAVRALMEVAPFAGALPIFIGDDLTDEQGFAACAEAGGAGILVGARENSVAQFQLPDVASVHRWLAL
ncbi:MAG: trehalose-phosphatase [Erythrobacter sp.]